MLGPALVLVGLAGCASPTGPGGDPTGGAGAPAGDLVTLVKLTGWYAAYRGDEPFSMLEVAYDDATAERLWAEQVPGGLPRAPTTAGAPAAPGVYGDLADVDLATHVVAVWSSGESGSCPTWLTGLRTTDEGVVPEEFTGYDACTGDYNPYRLVIAVPREDLPAKDELPVPIVHPGLVIDPGQVRPYGE